MDADKISFYNNCFKNVFSIQEYNNYGNICVYVKNIDIKFIKSVLNDFLEFAKYIVNKGLEVSKKLNKDQFCVHIYLDGCTRKNFSLPLFKKINKVFMEGEEDILNTLYIYNKNPVCIKMIQLVKQIMDKDTRKKIVIIKQ
tara:strand:- start:1937 stop:2359 length:423 start_codon:yes stop_codon:yes gene_type:complete